MTLKLFGAILIIAGCGSFGFLMAAAHRKEANTLSQLISVLEYMENILQYHMLPLPDICRQIDSNCSGNIRRVFMLLAEELDRQIAPNVQNCMDAALSKSKDIPKLTYDALISLGSSLGHFGLEGQLKGIAAVRADCEDKLKMYTENQEMRLRTYQTLALCAGAAIAILFI